MKNKDKAIKNHNICKYCEHCRSKKSYMDDCTKHKKVTFFDFTCSDYQRCVGSDDDLED